MARFIMAGRFQAAGFVIVLALLPVLGLLANAAIALVTLRKGWQEGLLITLIGSVAMALLTYVEQHNVVLGFVMALIQWIPVVLLAWVLNQTISWKITLQMLFGLSVLAVFVLHILIPDITIFLSTLFDSTMMNNARLSTEDKTNLGELKQAIPKIAPVFVGVITAIVSGMIIIALLIARYWQAQLYNPGGFGEELRELRLGKLSALIMLSIVILELLTQSYMVAELLICGVAVFLFQGIALVHALVKRNDMHQLWLVAMYLLLILLNWRMAPILAAVGIIDSFADFRRQFIKQ